MAKAFVNRYYGERFEAESAGLEPGKLNPLAIEAMAEDGIDISTYATKSVEEILRAGKSYDYVVTVCDETSTERCPAFPGNAKRLHWSFPDPSQFTGIHVEKLEDVRVMCATPLPPGSPPGAKGTPGVCNAAR